MCAARHTRRSPVIPAKLVPNPDRGAGSHRSPVFPAKLVPDPGRGAGIHPAAHPSFPRSLFPAPVGGGNPSRRSPVIPAKLVRDPDRGAAIHPAAHLSFQGSLSPAPIGERESILPLLCLSRESGNPYVLEVGLPLDNPKVHGKTGVVAKTK